MDHSSWIAREPTRGEKPLIAAPSGTSTALACANPEPDAPAGNSRGRSCVPPCRVMRPIEADLLFGDALYREVILDKLAHARESVWISTANLKAMYVERPDGEFKPVLDLFSELARRGVELRILHAELPSRPFRAEFDRRRKLVEGGLGLKICPRVHFKCVLVDGAWVYLGSANLTGAGLGAKDKDRRNFELGFVTEDFDVVDRVSALFQSVWSGAECATCKLRDICPDPIGAPKAKASKSRVKRSGARSLGSTVRRPKDTGTPMGIELGKSRRFAR